MSKSPMKPEKKPRGNQTKYTPEIAEYICLEMAKGRSVRDICREEGMPNDATVNAWVIDDREGFAGQYARARQLQMRAMECEILDILDADPVLKADGSIDSAWVTIQKNRADGRRWLMGKIAPKIYGDKLDLQHTGANGGPIEVRNLTDAQLDDLIARQLAECNKLSLGGAVLQTDKSATNTDTD